jgi:hypothetical protein
MVSFPLKPEWIAGTGPDPAFAGLSFLQDEKARRRQQERMRNSASKFDLPNIIFLNLIGNVERRYVSNSAGKFRQIP